MNKLLTLLLLVAATYCRAQVSAYSFAASTGTFTEISGGTVVTALSSNAGLSGPIPIGFDFIFNRIGYNKVVASSDGFLSFNMAATIAYNNNLANSAASVRPLLAPLWDDLSGEISNCQFSYITTGVAGTRIFTAEWKKWQWNSSASGAVISFQVKLYEGTNKIEFIYRPESTAVYYGAASVGIAAVGTGGGKFLSLNNLGASPTVSSINETVGISTKPDSGRVYTFTPPPLPAIDLYTTEINVVPETCPTTVLPLGITVKNDGTNTIDFSTTNTTISVNITGPITQNLSTTISSGTLAPGATQAIAITPGINAATSGTYTIRSVVHVAGDGNTSNDTLTSSTIAMGTTTAPWIERFTSVYPLPTGWKTSDWAISQFITGNTTINTNLSVYRRFRSSADTSTLTTLSVGPVSPTDRLSFDYKVANSISINTLPAAGWGSFKVQISTDCGSTFTTIDSVTNATTAVGWDFKAYSLVAYAGQSVTVRIVPTWSSGDYFLVFDNFKIKTPATTDIAVAGTLAAISTCPSATVPLSVLIRNDGTDPINFTTRNAIIKTEVNGPTYQQISTTINSGVLAPGATQTVALSTIGNLSVAGDYNLSSIIAMSGDGDRSNDTITSTAKTSFTVTTVPWSEPFASVYNSPGWNTSSGWTINSSAAVTGNPGYCLFRNLTSVGSSGFITVTVGLLNTNNYLRFDYKVSNATSPYGPPPANWGYFAVQISPNCTTSWTSIDTVKVAGNGWVNQSYDLSAYANQYITIRIITTNTNGNWNMAFDNFQIFAPPPIDLAMLQMTVPPGRCPNPDAPVDITIKNLGTTTVDFAATSATITANATGPVPQTLTTTISSGNLAPLATKTVTITPGFNLNTGGNYNFKGYVSVAGDGTHSNDTATAAAITIEANTTTTAPWTELFTTAAIPNGWFAGGWNVGAARGAIGNPGNCIYQTITSSSQTYSITTLTVGPLPANSYMGFDYKVSGTTSPYSPLTSGFGSIVVQISTDCSGSSITLGTITTANAGWASKYYSMAAYAGKKVYIRLLTYGTSTPLDFAFDNFRFYTLPATDLAMQFFNLTEQFCPKADERLRVDIKNNSTDTVDFSNRNVLVTAQVSGPIPQTLTTTVSSGIVAPGATYVTAITTPPNLTVAGTYQFKGYIAAVADSNQTNDTLTFTRTNGMAVPWSEPFADTIPSPIIIPNGWQIGAVRGATGNPGNNIYYNLFSDTFRTFSTKAIGPIGPDNYLRFDYKLSDVAPPYNAPNAGWGYFKVQVSTNCGTTFTTIDSITTAGNGWVSKSYSLANYAGNNIRLQITPHWATGNYDLAFDNFKVLATGSVCTPPASGYTDQRTNTSARVNFTGSGTNFTIEYGPYGFTPGTGASAGGGTVVAATSSPLTISGLAPGTGYTFYIRQNCTATNDGFSTNRLIDSFTTTATPLPLTNDLPANAITLTVGSGCTGALYTINGATQASGEPAVSCSGTLTGGKVVWFKFAAPASGFVKVSTDAAGNTLTDTKAALFSATDSANFSTFQIIACDDDNGVINNGASIFYATGLTPGRAYYIAVDGYSTSDTGRFCVQVAAADTGMIAASSNCNAGQQLPQYLPDYKGWLSVTDFNGRLVANIRSNITMSGAITYYPFLYVNTGPVRQAATSEYYLDRNFTLVNNFPTTPGNWDVQFFLLNRELAALQAVAPGTTLSDINVTRGKDSLCHAVFPSGSADTLLMQSASGTVSGISWVTTQTTRLANFYLNPGASPLPRIYTFTGNGAWSDPANWSDNMVPPAVLPPNSVIEIKPAAGGQCILDITQRIPAGDRLRIKSGTNVVIPGSVIIQ